MAASFSCWETLQKRGDCQDSAFLRKELQLNSFLLAKERHEKEARLRQMAATQDHMQEKVEKMRTNEKLLKSKLDGAYAKMYDINDEY